MTSRPLLLFIFIAFQTLQGTSQSLNDKILMEVAGTPVSAGEFMRMYNKSIPEESRETIDTYLQQFIIFRLKVADAAKAGIDTTKAFRNELSGYRNQLAQNYLTDKELKEKLLKRIYERSLIDINASHILISCQENAYPDDTLEAWSKASDIRTRIISGEDFEQVARASSDDPSVKENGGNLGYFTVFQMITPFEDAAYSLKKGTVSEPVRTPYGYHIIKVNGQRASNGRIQVAHIMKASPPGITEAEVKKAKASIDSIYRMLIAGGNFSELANKYSDHRESAERGGLMDWFGTGEIISDFSEAAFSLKDTGTFTKPIRTIYGWHIIKLTGKKSSGTFEETRSFLESKINQSYLTSISRKSFITQLKKSYKFRINQESYNWFIANTDTLIIQGIKKYDRSLVPSGTIYSFANQSLSNREFASYIERRRSIISTHDSSLFIKQTLDTRVEDHIITYENSQLEKKYPEFRYLINEFHDGIMLFEISDRKIWSRLESDTAGLRDFYRQNINDYLSPRKREVKLYILHSKGDDKKLNSAYRKYSQKEMTDDLIKRKFNRNIDTTLVIKDIHSTEGTDDELDNLRWEIGWQSISYKGYPAIAVTKIITPPLPIPFNDVAGEIMGRYQEYLENDWVKQLKEKYSVKIDNSVFEEIKKNLKE